MFHTERATQILQTMTIKSKGTNRKKSWKFKREDSPMKYPGKRQSPVKLSCLRPSHKGPCKG